MTGTKPVQVQFLLKAYVERRGSADRPKTISRHFQITIIAAVVAVLGLGTASAIPGSRLDAVKARFEQEGERRPEIWEDATFSAGRFWPAGAGMGTFDEVYQVDESLEHISARRAGRAHNEYLELVIEAGPLGIAAVLGWAIAILLAGWVALSDEHRRWPALAGSGILLATALQSALEFPLRNQAMLCIAALAIVLLLPPGEVSPPVRRKGASAA